MDPSKINNTFKESNSNFTIICIISANSPSEIDFLFHPSRKNKTLLLGQIQSKFKGNFIWTSNLTRELSRNSHGDYYCRDSHNHHNIANVSIHIICTII